MQHRSYLQAELLHHCICGCLNGMLGKVIPKAHQMGVVNFLQQHSFARTPQHRV